MKKDILNVLAPREAAFIGEIPLPGLEFAGEVIGVRNEVETKLGLVVGDRVFGLNSERLGMLRFSEKAVSVLSAVVALPSVSGNLVQALISVFNHHSGSN